MQPNQPQQDTPDTWQPPQEAVPQSPYQPVAVPETPPSEPVVDEPEPSVVVTDEPQIDAPAEGTAAEPADLADNEVLVRWQSTEYIHHDQTKLWYAVLAVATIILMVLAIVLMKSITFMLLIPVMAAALVVYTRRAPVVNDYIVSRKGLHINDRLYPFSLYKSFGVVTLGNAHSISLIPRKRFQVAQTIYFPEEVGEQLVDMLGARLPMKDTAPDTIDRLLARLKL